ncbi:hypothetical protein HGO38_24405 [Rhizobium sp. CG5]|uniref:hypothetical protein n=1 Tax=Rhizobium sp. CG5 TaxID=2726076 RepID=UPI0020345386|nr:hypothetical protein [Rhizobium sp. CG5]MCM2476593.1 hypothetical protein [Rhizobium sp. CG5]
MGTRERVINVLRLVEPIVASELKQSFDFTKKISDFVGMIVRMGILLALINVIYASVPQRGQEATYYFSMLFFIVIYCLFWISIFRVVSDLVDTIISAWMGTEFKSNVRDFWPAARNGRVRVVVANGLSLILLVLLHSGMEYGVSAYINR